MTREPDPVVLHVVLAADENYFPGLLVAAASLALTCSDSTLLRLHVLDGGIGGPNWQRLAARVRQLHPASEISRLSVGDSAIFGIHDNGGKSPMAYARLLAPQLVDVDRLIYVDSDCLIVGDLAPLAAIDLHGAPCAAVRDPIHQWLREDCPWQNAAESGESPYFNSGLLVIDVPRWRELRMTERALDLLRTDAAHCRYWDQTALNYLLRQAWQPLPDAWNFSSGSFDHEASPSVHLIHFLCNEKPWFGDTGDDAHALWRRFATEMAHLSRRELRLGIWRDQWRHRLEDRSALWVARWFARKQRRCLARGDHAAADAAGWAQRHWAQRHAERGARRNHRLSLAADLDRRAHHWRQIAAERATRGWPSPAATATMRASIE